jgi:hypothetical protein
MVVGHHGGLPEDVIAGLNLPERPFVNRSAPNWNVVDDLHRFVSLVEPVGIEPTSS